MILINLKMDNILAFENFEINFSYPKKLNKSTIEDEFLTFLPSFRYKKVNIFIGSNATGKTSLMKCIWHSLVFLSKKDRVFIDNIVNKQSDESYIELDLVDKFNDNTIQLIRVKIKVNNQDGTILTSINKISLDIGDSYETKKRLLDNLEDNYENYVDCLNKNDFNIGWFTALPATESGFDNVRFYKNLKDEESKEYLQILNDVLRTLDPAITKVMKSADSDDAYVIEHENIGKIIIQDGNRISSINYLSSGTKYGINIANIIFSIKKHNNGIYIVDEQFSYVNSDVEVALINTMVSLLGENEQLFITTHNSNVLDIRFPFHSFNFMKKEKMDDKSRIITLCASLVENRNNVSAKTILDNDMLATAPDLNKIFEIGE